jgi:4-amino-4-deoxy-L-arabinose transferase-like glycosyltransferase
VRAQGSLTTTDPVEGPDAPEAREARRFGWGLFGIAVAGFVVRLVAVATVGRLDPTGGDGYYYHQQANLLAKGHWFVDPFVWRATGRLVPGNGHPPLWTMWLAVSSAVGGSSFRAHKTMACLAGAVIVVAIGLLVREVAGRRAGLIGAVLAALNPSFWIIDGLLMSEELYAATVAFVVLLVYRWRRSPTVGRAAALGAMLAVASLTRPEIIALAPLLVVPVVLFRRQLSVRERLKQLVVCGAACAVLLAPWLVRQAVEFHRFEPFSINADELFVYANNPVAYGTADTPTVCTNPAGIARYPDGRFIAATHTTSLGYWSFAWQEYLRCQHGEPPGDGSDKGLYWRHQGLDYIHHHLGRLPVVLAARVGRTWEVYRPFQNSYFATFEGRTLWVSDLGLWVFWGLLAASAAGVAVLRRRRVATWPLLSLGVLVTITAMYAYGHERFRLPLDVAVVALAAVALDALWRRVRPQDPVEVAPQEPGFVEVAGVPPFRERVIARARRIDAATAAVLGVLLLAVLIPLRGLLLHPGAPMEEGFMLVFPERVLHGAVPNVDFLHLYGPGSLWFLAAGYWLFGTSVATERLLGLLQLSGIVTAVVLLARPFGRWLAAVSGLACVVVIVPPLGLVAMAWDGAVALAALSVVIALSTRRSPDDGAWQSDAALAAVEPAELGAARTRQVRNRVFVAGLVGGVALLFRPDLVIAVSLGLAGALWAVRRRAWRPLLAGAVVGLAPYLVHLAVAGPRAVVRGMFIEPVFRLRPGRSLPAPPSLDHIDGFLQRASSLRPLHWPLPHLGFEHEVFVWFWLVPLATLALLAAGWLRRRRSPELFRGQVLIAAGLLSAGMLPQAFQRADSAHFAWASCISIPLLPVAVAELVTLLTPAVTARWRTVLATAVAVVVLAGALPLLTVRPYVDYGQQAFGGAGFGWPIRNGGRSFSYGSEPIAAAGNQLAADLAARSRPGERLFVGPIDLRKTPYSQAFWYFLFPQLVPSTYFIELDPWLANRPGSRLAGDVASADWLILTSVGDQWQEPNASKRVGSPAPNDVVRSQFCVVRAYGVSDQNPQGIWRLYHRCGP